ncbi:hypothetical protein FA95DRAFT_1558462 [Auriscalpium vulgare]|uniref:Uncharacterized protein n=1 Tax=Auriscalpium vulgare TaxID=40419 RepID=A0ACB8RUZ9_9AGAM|nr:hypothetical protein FA95DRAFT_1558462 [Auriscalpium vulgare]
MVRIALKKANDSRSRTPARPLTGELMVLYFNCVSLVNVVLNVHIIRASTSPL